MKSCKECEYAILIDEGYSNYTVENTTFNCATHKHPDEPFDNFYGKDEKLNFAGKCSGFSLGEPIEIDVDGENYELLTEKQKLIHKAWESND